MLNCLAAVRIWGEVRGLSPRRAKSSQQSIYRVLSFFLNKGAEETSGEHIAGKQEKGGKETWLAAEVEKEELIENNPPFQHPLILPQLFLFERLAVEDICGSRSRREKKKTAFPTICSSASDQQRYASGYLISGLHPRVLRPQALAAVARGIRSRCAT